MKMLRRGTQVDFYEAGGTQYVAHMEARTRVSEYLKEFAVDAPCLAFINNVFPDGTMGIVWFRHGGIQGHDVGMVKFIPREKLSEVTIDTPAFCCLPQ
jgi:hypothetical protein